MVYKALHGIFMYNYAYRMIAIYHIKICRIFSDLKSGSALTLSSCRIHNIFQHIRSMADKPQGGIEYCN